MLLLILSQGSKTQISIVDSLEHELLFVKNAKEKSIVLEALFDALQENDATAALKVALEYRAINPLNETTEAYNRMQAQNLCGIAYMNLSQNDSSLFYFQKLLSLAEEEKDSVFISKAYNNLAALHFNLEDYTSAISYSNKSAFIDESIGDLEGSLVSYMNVGAVYVAIGALDSGKHYLSKALEISLRKKDNFLIGTCYLNIGSIEHRAENNSEALALFDQAIAYGKLANSQYLMASSYRNKAIIYQKINNYPVALENDLMGLEYALLSNNIDLMMHAHRGVAYNYEQMGNYKDALSNYRSFIQLQDSLNEVTNQQTIIEMQEKYKAEQAQKENQILTQKNKIQDLEIEQNAKEIQNSRIVIISSIVGLVLLFILALTLYNRNLIKQKANQKLQHAYAIIQEKNNDILASIDYASKIQEALLPTRENKNLFPESFFILMPKDIVSGDFLWYSQNGTKKIIAVVDCTGHGVPGAFMSMIGNTFLHQIVNEREILEPHEILTQLRRQVIHALNQKGNGVNRKDGMDMAICVLDEKTKHLEFAGANNPLYAIVGNQMIEIKGDKQPVGYFEGNENPFTKHTFQLSAKDSFYLFTDGFADQFGGPKGKKYKYKQLKDLLFQHHHVSMQEQKKVLINSFENWKGSLEQVDDVCVIGIRVS
jgi:serine phosphatase RsbU (regulator of sigma subunit)